MRVFETELPGVGRRYTVRFGDGGEFVVLIHNDGNRETFWRDDPDGDSDRLFQTTEPQARKLAEIFDGTYFHTVAEDLDDAFENARIRWIEIDSTSPLADETLRGTGLRTRSGVSVLAIQRGTDTIANPDPDVVLAAGDTIVTVGTEAAYERLHDLLDG
ncbi:potassium transporter TrkA [Haloarcula sp. S1CR25-12]|uniref:Potassium transporter TrkA n=1 Tax=Haloarcula saliterrae TaxID=2950534 RepID=A0ABU2F7K0_9EURY|nr:TrkA C-terminal domain-containing protein [Haloarcula sp. S1CR25-12]MDS0258237.1 potassium transporter TrkA [Haloarcula sp. S1CR25-12]